MVRSGDRPRLGAPATLERCPDASERRQRPVIIEREPDDILFLRLRVRLRPLQRRRTLGLPPAGRRLGVGQGFEPCATGGDLPTPGAARAASAHLPPVLGKTFRKQPARSVRLARPNGRP